MMILKLYYKIWVDFIKKVQSIPANKNNWKGITVVFMSMAMAINLVTIMTILQRNIFKYTFYDVKVDIFPGSMLNSLTSFFILFLLPNLIINYFLIFRNERYKILLNKFKSYNGKLFFSYFAISLLAPLVFVIIWKIFF